MLLEFKVARGWKSIAEMVGAKGLTTVKVMVRDRGLPVKYDGKTPILNILDYIEWHGRLPSHQENFRSRVG